MSTSLLVLGLGELTFSFDFAYGMLTFRSFSMRGVAQPLITYLDTLRDAAPTYPPLGIPE